LRATGLNPVTSLCYSCPKEREVPGQLELDLKSYGKLRVDLLEDLPYCTGVLFPGHRSELTEGPSHGEADRRLWSNPVEDHRLLIWPIQQM
jgi:hypothetical protein